MTTQNTIDIAVCKVSPVDADKNLAFIREESKPLFDYDFIAEAKEGAEEYWATQMTDFCYF